jgi:RNA polymerase sigma-70 factor (ECF subfamily)
MDEKLVIAACKKMEPLAQRYLYDHYKGVAKLICNRYAADSEEAKDIMQEGFVKVFLNIDKFEEKGSLEGWIKRIMVNTAINHYKKNKRWNQKSSIHDWEQEKEKDWDASAKDIAVANDELEDLDVWDRYSKLSQEQLTMAIQSLPPDLSP